MAATEQQLVYLQNENDKQIKIDNTSSITSGYIRMKYKPHFPDDILKIILFFYGTIYYIYGEPPDTEKYMDYVVQLLSPMNKLGVQAQKNKIISLNTAWAKKNVICGSRIIQINEEYMSPQAADNRIRSLISNAKQYTPSHVILRCKKVSCKQGIHLKFDITYNQTMDIKLRFPYYMFTKRRVLTIFQKVFATEDKQLDIMEIAAQKQCSNGRNGISILLFVESDQRNFADFEILTKSDELNKHFKGEINTNLSVLFVDQMFDIRANGFSCNYFTKSLFDECYVIKTQENDERNAWYIAMIDVEKSSSFEDALKKDMICLEDYGRVLFSSHGDAPDVKLKSLCYEGIVIQKE